jgi:CMP-N-acetylneuraminic acid synthetase
MAHTDGRHRERSSACIWLEFLSPTVQAAEVLAGRDPWTVDNGQQEMTITAFVHAKRHSERCPGKNLRMLGDCPLFCHAIRIGLEAKLVNRVVIDSEDDEILRVGEEHGAMPLKRPKELATNDATGDDLAYWQAKHVMAEPAMVQIVPTSPFIRPQSVDEAIGHMAAEVNSVIGAHRDQLYRWSNKGRFARPEYRIKGPLPASDDLESTWWETTGLYVMRPDIAWRTHRRVDYEHWRLYWLSRIEAIDINTEEDFRFAEIVWRGLDSGLKP